MKSQSLFKYPQDKLYNSLALLFIGIAYFSGWILLFHKQFIVNGIGVLLIAEAMILSAFFIHEFAHGSIFASGRQNRMMGKLFMWLTAHSCFSFERIQRIHIAHHRNHADVIHFDYQHYLVQHELQQKIIYMLEWLYIPAVELLVKWQAMLRTWQDAHGFSYERRLIAWFITSYGTFFLLLLWLAPKVLVFYLIAYLIMVHVLRFMDMHQHTYQAYLLDANGDIPKLPTLDKTYEQANTYSNLLSRKHPWLNLLVLNFSYHNAHHTKSFIPWCRLPQLHEQLYHSKNSATDSILPALSLLKNYHRFRAQRVVNPDMGMPNLKASPTSRADNFFGVIGASFLNA